MNPNYVILGLIGFIVIREWMFQYSTHKLLNKLMSRSYHEYQVASAMGQEKKFEAPKEEMDYPEDIRHLTYL